MRPPRSWFLVALALGVVAGFGRLPEAGLQFLDSWCYARVSAEMAASGDWVVPTWRGEPFLEKPPLLFWLTALLFRIFGVSDFAARAISGASVTGCVLLVYALGTRAAGRATGLLGALLLCLLPMFIKWGRTYTTDPLFSLLCLGALACAWLGTWRPWAWPVAGALAALAVLTRGAASTPLLMTLPLVGILQAGAAPELKRRWPWFLATLLVFAAVAVPWHSLAIERTGALFVRTYIDTHTLARLQENLIDSPHAADPLYYLKHLARTAWPALPLLGWGLVRLRWAWRPRLDPAGLLDRTLIVYLCAHGLMLAVVASRSPRYLLPLYPVLALLAARGLGGGLGIRAQERMLRWSAAGVAVAVTLVAVWPTTVGTPRGEPFRALARAIERQPAGTVVEVDPELHDAWFERAFWFYLGRAPEVSGSQRGAATPERMRIEPQARAASCEPPRCQVIERAGPFVLTTRSAAVMSGSIPPTP